MCAVLLCYCFSFLYRGTQYFRTVEPNNNNNNNKKKMYGLITYIYIHIQQKYIRICSHYTTMSVIVRHLVHRLYVSLCRASFFYKKICHKCTSVCLTIVYNYRLLRLLMFYVLYYRPLSYLILTVESPVSHFYKDCGVRISAFCGCGGL